MHHPKKSAYAPQSCDFFSMYTLQFWSSMERYRKNKILKCYNIWSLVKFLSKLQPSPLRFHEMTLQPKPQPKWQSTTNLRFDITLWNGHLQSFSFLANLPMVTNYHMHFLFSHLSLSSLSQPICFSLLFPFVIGLPVSVV